MKNKFEKGDLVVIKSSGLAYNSYVKMAKKLKATNWKKHRIRIKDGAIVTIINSFEEYYLIRDSKGYEYIFSEKGLKSFGENGWFSKQLIKMRRSRKGWSSFRMGIGDVDE